MSRHQRVSAAIIIGMAQRYGSGNRHDNSGINVSQAAWRSSIGMAASGAGSMAGALFLPVQPVMSASAVACAVLYNGKTLAIGSVAKIMSRVIMAARNGVA